MGCRGDAGAGPGHARRPPSLGRRATASAAPRAAQVTAPTRLRSLGPSRAASALWARWPPRTSLLRPRVERTKRRRATKALGRTARPLIHPLVRDLPEPGLASEEGHTVQFRVQNTGGEFVARDVQLEIVRADEATDLPIVLGMADVLAPGQLTEPTKERRAVLAARKADDRTAGERRRGRGRDYLPDVLRHQRVHALAPGVRASLHGASGRATGSPPDSDVAPPLLRATRDRAPEHG
jgi:hypothetical protein